MKNTGQSLIEYAIMIGIIVAALFAMQVYLKRGVAGKMRSSADELGGGYFYSPGATSSTIVVDTETRIQSSSRVGDDPDNPDYKISTLTTDVTNSRTTNRAEEVASFSAEPQRWQNETPSE